MKLYFILVGSLLMISLNTLYCKNYRPKDKRSVFDMISHTDEETTELSSHTTVLDMAVKEVKVKEYQELKNIVLDKRTKQKKINQSRKRNLKKMFLEESKRSHDSKFRKRKQEKIILNFYFLTKLS